MRRKKGLLSIVICGVMLLSAGCGTKPYDLTKEDQKKVADYAAHVVTKHNDNQEEGILKVSQEDIRKAEEKNNSKKEKKKAQTDTKKTERETDSGAQEETKPKEETVSLKKALGLGEGMNASFDRYEVTASYVEADYFAMNATAGKTYLVLHMNLSAEGTDAQYDMFSKNLNFRVVINGQKEVGAQTSILLNDLSTYQGTVKPGEPQGCVLLFETEPENVENITSLQLKVLKGSASSMVELQ